MVRFIIVSFIIWFTIPSISYSQIKQKSLKMKDKSIVSYSACFPEKYKKADSLTLVIALHWGWGKGELPENFSENFLNSFINPIYKNDKTIIIAPDCPGKSWVDDVSVASVLSLREDCIEKYNIDTNNIIITGFSLGGIGTWYLATHYSNLFNYAVPIAGYPEKEWVEQLGDIRLLVVNSVNDEIIPFKKVKTAVEYLKNKNIDIRLRDLYGIGHYDTGLFIKPVKENLYK